MQQTLSIIKPDATNNPVVREHIHALLERRGLSIIKLRRVLLTHDRAQEFYAEHQGKHFFDGLIHFMCSGHIYVQILEGEQAIERYRQLMGATNPAKAGVDTIRGQYGRSTMQNAVHGSDSAASAQREIHFFFPELRETVR